MPLDECNGRYPASMRWAGQVSPYGTISAAYGLPAVAPPCRRSRSGRASARPDRHVLLVEPRGIELDRGHFGRSQNVAARGALSHVAAGQDLRRIAVRRGWSRSVSGRFSAVWVQFAVFLQSIWGSEWGSGAGRIGVASCCKGLLFGFDGAQPDSPWLGSSVWRMPIGTGSATAPCRQVAAKELCAQCST